MRVMYEPWFVKYKVDVVFAGHVHAYERSVSTKIFGLFKLLQHFNSFPIWNFYIMLLKTASAKLPIMYAL